MERYEMDNNRLYVGNLSWNTDEAGLESAFGAFGDVSDVKIITDRDTGRSRGFGFVTMKTDEEAEAAMGALNGSMLDGRALRVNVAEARKPRSSGGGYSSDRGDRGGRPRW